MLPLLQLMQAKRIECDVATENFLELVVYETPTQEIGQKLHV